METNTTSRRTLIVIAAVVGVLVVAAVAVALRPPATLDASTPEGTAQRYYQAIDDGEVETAMSYLAEDLTDRCNTEEMRYWIRERDTTGIRVVILDAQIDEATARVDVRITESYGSGPFDGGSYSHDETLDMQRNDGRWLIRGIPWPWEPYMCAEVG